MPKFGSDKHALSSVFPYTTYKLDALCCVSRTVNMPKLVIEIN
jgi:hypothetical protein